MLSNQYLLKIKISFNCLYPGSITQTILMESASISGIILYQQRRKHLHGFLEGCECCFYIYIMVSGVSAVGWRKKVDIIIWQLTQELDYQISMYTKSNTWRRKPHAPIVRCPVADQQCFIWGSMCYVTKPHIYIPPKPYDKRKKVFGYLKQLFDFFYK